MGSAGASVAVVDINEKTATKVMNELKKKGINAIAVKTNVTIKKSMTPFLSFFKEREERKRKGRKRKAKERKERRGWKRGKGKGERRRETFFPAFVYIILCCLFLCLFMLVRGGRDGCRGCV